MVDLTQLFEALQRADAEDLRKILATHEPEPLPAPVQARLKDIVNKYKEH